MSSPATVQHADPLGGIEYSVYVFTKDEAGGPLKWEKHSSPATLAEAQEQTEELFRTGKYEKVEVKQKFFDYKKNRNIDVSLKVLEVEQPRKAGSGTAIAFLLVALCGIAAFALTGALTHRH